MYEGFYSNAMARVDNAIAILQVSKIKLRENCMSYLSSYTWQVYGTIPGLSISSSFPQICAKCLLDAKNITIY